MERRNKYLREDPTPPPMIQQQVEDQSAKRGNVHLQPLNKSINGHARNASMPPKQDDDPLHPINNMNLPSKPAKLQPMDHERHKMNLSAVAVDDYGSTSGSAVVSQDELACTYGQRAQTGPDSKTQVSERI